MTADLVERLDYIANEQERFQPNNGRILAPSEIAEIREAAREIARLRASPPVDELIEAVEDLCAVIEGMNCTAPQSVIDKWMTAYRKGQAAIRRAREVSDRLKGEG